MQRNHMLEIIMKQLILLNGQWRNTHIYHSKTKEPIHYHYQHGNTLQWTYTLYLIPIYSLFSQLYFSFNLESRLMLFLSHSHVRCILLTWCCRERTNLCCTIIYFLYISQNNVINVLSCLWMEH